MVKVSIFAIALAALFSAPVSAQQVNGRQSSPGVWLDRMSEKDFEAMEGVCLMAVEAKSEKYDAFLKDFFSMSNTPEELQTLYYRFCLTYIRAYAKGAQEAIKRRAVPIVTDPAR